MAEYIDRDAVVTYLRSRQSEFIDDYGKGWSNGVGTAAQICEKFQAADVAPVRHGRWEKQRGIYHCSECGKVKPYDVQADEIEYFHCNYCPNCGAKMDFGKSDGK